MNLDENQIKNVNDQLSLAIKQLEKLNTSSTVASKNSSILSQTLNSINQDEKKVEEQLGKLNEGLKKSASGMLRFAKTLENNGSSFKPLNSAITVATKVLGALAGVIPIVGEKLQKVAEGAGEVAKFMVDSFEKSYGMFEKLSGTGVVQTFEDFRQSADLLNLSFESANRVLSSVSKDLALFGGSASKGRQLFLEVGFESIELRDKFQKLGISAADFTEFQASYIAQQQIISGGEKKTARELREGTERYINEIDLMSKVTGMDRKKIQDSMRARMEDAKYMATVYGMKENTKTKVDNLITMVESFGPGIAQGVKEMITAQVNGTVANGPEANALRLTMNNVGVDIERVIGEMIKGNLDWVDVTQLITNNSGKAAQQIAGLTRVYGDSLSITKISTDLTKAATYEGKINNKTIQEIIAQNKKTMEATDGQNAQLANTRISLIKAQKNIEQLATESETVTKIMELMAEGIEEITIKFYKMSKTDMPEHLKAREKELEEIKKLKELEQQRIKIMQTSPDEAAYMYGSEPVDTQLSRLEEQILKQQGVVSSATSARHQAQQKAGLGTPTTSAPQPPQVPTTPPPEMPSGGGASGRPGDTSDLVSVRSKTGKSAQVGKKYAGAFQKLIDYLDGVGYNIYSLGGYNDRNIAGTNTKSIHAYGGAIDINPAENPYGRTLITDMPREIGQVAKSLGLGWGGAWTSVKDAMHFSAAEREGGSLLKAKTGGIFSGPSTGYLAELHGDEIVVPANEGSSKQQFISDMSSDVLTGTTKILYDDMSSKMDELVRLLDDTVQSQNKFLQQAMS